MKKISTRFLLASLALLGMTVVSLVSAATYPNTEGTGQQWVTSPSTTGASGCYTGWDTVTCTGGNLVFGAQHCDATSNVTVLGSSSASAYATNENSIAGGGFYYNCIGSDTTAPLDNWTCRADETNVTNNIETQCTGAGASQARASTENTGTNCLGSYLNCSVANGGDGSNNTCETLDGGSVPGTTRILYNGCTGRVCETDYLDCDGSGTNIPSDTDCEVQKNVTDADGSFPHTSYGSTCSEILCDSGWLASDGAANDADGCEIQENEACTADNGTTNGETGESSDGEAGVCVSTAHASSATDGIVAGTADFDLDACNCDLSADPQTFKTGVEASYNASSALLKGKQQSGTGSLIKMVGSDDSTRFEVDNSGAVTTGYIGGANITSNNLDATSGHVLKWNGSTVVWDSASAGSVAFTDLTDTPANFTDQAQKFLRVNATADAIEFTTLGTILETQGGTGITTYAAGDILYADGANSLAKLAAGSNGQVLTLSGGVPSWQVVPSGADDLGDHTATQNLDLATFKLVGTGGSTGLAISAFGASTFDGDVTISGGDAVLGNNTNAGTLSFGDGEGTTAYVTKLQSGDLSGAAADIVFTLPNTDGAADQILKTDGSGNLSWVADQDTDTDTTIADGLSCTDNQVLTWNNTGSVWQCADDSLTADLSCADGEYLTWDNFNTQWACTAKSDLDDAYNEGRTLTVDSGPVTLTHSGLDDALLVWDGVDTYMVVDQDGEVGVNVADPQHPLDVSGVTRSNNFKLIATSNGSGTEPSTTCDATTDGNIEYVVGNDSVGRYYGCKANPSAPGGYAWVLMEIFGE
ncbi:MAG: hypothetical protein K9M51_02310 [Candidatus Gracilibacteria bacterium]|nr:hypothetical protein [Candidatus Gracilibacteria bacterium]